VKVNKFRLVFGSILLLVEVALLVFWKNMDSKIIGALAGGLGGVGGATIIRGFLWPKRKFFTRVIYSDTPEEDERTRKIGAFATAYAWCITAILMSVLISLELFNLLKMNVIEVLCLIFSVMIAATVGLYAYFKRKGDVG